MLASALRNGNGHGGRQRGTIGATSNGTQPRRGSGSSSHARTGAGSAQSRGRGLCRQVQRRPLIAAADGGEPCAPVRRRAAASSAEGRRSRCVASAEAIAVAPSAIGAAEGARERCVAGAEAMPKAPSARGASRCAAIGTRSRSTHPQFAANRVGRESGAEEGPRSRDAMRDRRRGGLPVGVRPTGKVGTEIRAARVEPAHRCASSIDASKKRMNGRLARRFEEVKRYARGCTSIPPRGPQHAMKKEKEE